MAPATTAPSAGGPGDIVRATAADLAGRLAAGDVTSEDVVRAHLDRIAAVDGAPGDGRGVAAYLHVSGEEALATARDVDARRAAGEALPALAGVPVAVKDVVVTRGTPTTAGSKILRGWVPPYDATLVERLRAAGMPLLGKTNMDEFAMGSSTEHSAYGPTRNPWDLARTPGGSGGGSAAAVAAFEAPLAVGTDTGGSIRQPASVTGSVGVKPTYGGVSRYGLIAMASSLDQAGPCARTVLDAALLHEVMGGHDPRDATSLADPVGALADAARSRDVRGLRVGVVRELTGEGFSAGVTASFRAALDLLADAGAEVVEVSCPTFAHALDAYYLIMPSEASSNLARFDGMRFGLRVEPSEGPVTAERVMAATRGAGFGPEVKRRVVLGTYALSAGYYDAYYGSAQKVRTLVQRDFASSFEQADVLVSPTAPTTAFPLGSRLDDPLAMYAADIATIPANLAGVPGMSLPSGLAEDGLPVGFQVMAPARADERLYRLGGALEALLDERRGGPLLASAPDLPARPDPSAARPEAARA
ncbi:Asp-tRNA(Asn)/Glu-tRNA(Gln) amidotransferase subunit GatA [Pseudokineococcus basanitobsidens]|uniref:Glutamyl-tRNA(Gln) amidotransferase subunit A n=1 Tax=Pseudokineococcus basanitobsidens TaxID=1926649 RepID=A0ABU8RIA6_9ACTN